MSSENEKESFLPEWVVAQPEQTPPKGEILESTVDNVATEGQAWYEQKILPIGAGFLISGPLGASNFPGRRFTNMEAAKRWAVEKYAGVQFLVSPVGRWIFRVIPRGTEGN